MTQRTITYDDATHALVPLEPTEKMVVVGFESEPDEYFSPHEEWEKYKAMTGCRQAEYRARECWVAMLAAAPQPDHFDDVTKIVTDMDAKALEVTQKIMTTYGRDPSQLVSRIQLAVAGAMKWAACQAAASAKPVAWMHDGPGRVDVIHADVKKLLQGSHESARYLHRSVDKSEHYTIPLYAPPVAAQAVPTWNDLQKLAIKHHCHVPGYGPFAAELLAKYGATPEKQPEWLDKWLTAMHCVESNAPPVASQAQPGESSFLTRLCAEASDLDTRCHKLGAFIATREFYTLPGTDKGLMLRQLNQQQALLETLHQRIHSATEQHMRSERHD